MRSKHKIKNLTIFIKTVTFLNVWGVFKLSKIV